MDASTPLTHRGTREQISSSPENSPIAKLGRVGNEDDSLDPQCGGDGKTGISWETSRTILDENKVPESKEEELARNVVTVEAFGSAERRYADGLNKAEREGDILQEIDLNAWEKDLRFKRYNSDSRSREMDSLELSMTCDLGD